MAEEQKQFSKRLRDQAEAKIHNLRAEIRRQREKEELDKTDPMTEAGVRVSELVRREKEWELDSAQKAAEARLRSSGLIVRQYKTAEAIREKHKLRKRRQRQKKREQEYQAGIQKEQQSRMEVGEETDEALLAAILAGKD